MPPPRALVSTLLCPPHAFPTPYNLLLTMGSEMYILNAKVAQRMEQLALPGELEETLWCLEYSSF